MKQTLTNTRSSAHDYQTIDSVMHSPKICYVPPETRKNSDRDITYKVATSKDELLQSFELLHNVYVAKEYMMPNRERLRLSIHNLLPFTRTIVAKNDDCVIGCITVIPDSSFGLPMDQIYANDLCRLRSGDKKIAEFSGLALDPAYCSTYCRDESISFKLLLLAFGYIKNLGIDNICIAINPKHKYFYRKGLLFNKLNDKIFEYKSVNNAPAVALSIAANELYHYLTQERTWFYRLAKQYLLQDQYLESSYSAIGNRDNLLESIMNKDLIDFFMSKIKKISSKLTEDDYSLALLEYDRYLPAIFTPFYFKGHGRNIPERVCKITQEYLNQ